MIYQCSFSGERTVEIPQKRRKSKRRVKSYRQNEILGENSVDGENATVVDFCAFIN